MTSIYRKRRTEDIYNWKSISAIFCVDSWKTSSFSIFFDYFEELIATNCYNINKFLKNTNNFKNIFLNWYLFAYNISIYWYINTNFWSWWKINLFFTILSLIIIIFFISEYLSNNNISKKIFWSKNLLIWKNGYFWCFHHQKSLYIPVFFLYGFIIINYYCF